jgi:glycosyltransferase involved in cell wall biosynthesis
MSSIWVVTFYAGQIIEPEDFESKPVFGSELALLEIFSRVGKTNNVSVFIQKPPGYQVEKNNITWRSEADFNSLITKGEKPDHIVISRYISAMCELLMPPESQIWLWCHDITPHHAYQGKSLRPDFCKNMQKRLSGVVAVGDSQIDEIIIPQYDLPKRLFKTIKNGITLEPNYNPIEQDRCSMSFVYCSGTQRGLWNLLKLWPTILNKWHWATLQIFHSLSEEDMKKIKEMNLPRVHPMGRVNQSTLFKKLKVIDYWVYPCVFFETCCTTAIEMQYYGPVCISNKLGALKENNNGILLENDTFGEQVISTIERLESNPEEKMEIRRRQYEWAKEQTWDKRAEDWNNLVGYDVNAIAAGRY